MSSSAPLPAASAKRAGPPKVPALHVDGVRYEPYRLSRQEAGGGQRLGWLAAFKGDSAEQLWRVRVYAIKVDPRLEGDVQDVFFAAMALSPDGRQVFVDNERGERFAVDIDGEHAVHPRP